jgi:oligopeptide transport system substrate-binding protein
MIYNFMVLAINVIMRRFIGLPLVVLSLVVLLSACSGKKALNVDEAMKQGILLIGNGSEPQSLDPHLSSGALEHRILSSLMEGLVNYHETSDTSVVPGMADRWESSENASVWTFHIRENARWSNGDPVVASDFVYAWQRMLTPEIGAPYANMLYMLKGAEAYNTGVVNDFETVGVKALDAQTLRIELIGPTPYFLSMLQHSAWLPLNPRCIESFGGMKARVSEWTRPSNFVSNGAFILDTWITNQLITVRKNPDYWDADRVKLNGIYFFPIESTDAEERSFFGKQLHLTYSVSSAKIEYLKKNEPQYYRSQPALGIYYYCFNVNKFELKDSRVRQALTLAVDRKVLVEKVTRGGQIPATALTPAMEGYPALDMIAYDPVRAKELMAEAGYPEGKGMPKLEILYNTLDDHRKIAEAIAQMWQTTLGVEVTLINQEWKVFLQTQHKHDFVISRAGWFGDYMDPLTFLDMWMTGNPNNYSDWSNPQYDALIRDALQAPTAEEHYAFLQKAEQMLLTELPVMPLYWYTRVILCDPRVKGWNPKLMDVRNWKYISLESN